LDFEKWAHAIDRVSQPDFCIFSTLSVNYRGFFLALPSSGHTTGVGGHEDCVTGDIVSQVFKTDLGPGPGYADRADIAAFHRGLNMTKHMFNPCPNP
jgi:hypothetical protein